MTIKSITLQSLNFTLLIGFVLAQIYLIHVQLAAVLTTFSSKDYHF